MLTGYKYKYYNMMSLYGNAVVHWNTIGFTPLRYYNDASIFMEHATFMGGCSLEANHSCSTIELSPWEG